MAAACAPRSLWQRICEEHEREEPSLPPGYKSKGSSIICIKDNQYDEGLCDGISSARIPDPKTCSPQEYLESCIFPVLLPGMAEMLTEAKKEKCFLRKRTKFIACDFLTQWLYNKNPLRKDQQSKDFFEIPFVQEWLKDQYAVIQKSKNYASGKKISGRLKTLIKKFKNSGKSRNQKWKKNWTIWRTRPLHQMMPKSPFTWRRQLFRTQ
ncbi:IQ domain-containing protein K isoform X4 [Ranitomeya imitator]|uniref:IQ domain-containing protein K isoform X4 n=1 Tax=Ranitomeya imitator TaxID=111125 RepID=UPI0037E992CD